MRSFKEWLTDGLTHLTLSFLFSLLGIELAISALTTWIVGQVRSALGLAGLPAYFYLLLGIVVFCAVSLFAILVVCLQRTVTGAIAKAPPSSPRPSIPAEPRVLLPSPPKTVDLRGQILELYLAQFEDLLHTSRTYMVMKVRIVNHGADEVTISGVGARASLADFSVDGEIITTDLSWLRIKRKREGVLLAVVYDVLAIEPFLGVNPHEEVYKKGKPHEGWLAFEFKVWGNKEFPNAQVELFLKDALGNSHTVVRPAGVYEKTGELVRADLTSQTVT